MPDEFEAAVAAAIDGTSIEIFDSAFGQEESVHDETGDRSMEDMGDGLEGQHEVEDDDDDESEDEQPEETEESEAEESEEVEAQPKPDTEPAPKEPVGRPPAARLRQEAERARAAEAERDALKARLAETETSSRKELDEVKAQMHQLAQLLNQQQRQTEKPAQKADEPKPLPDLFEDPKGFVEHLTSQMRSELQQRDVNAANERLQQSMEDARERHGQVFDDAWKAVNALNPNNPQDRATVQSIYAARNQGEALVKWHQRNQTLARVGNDPAAFEERVRKETRDALMKDLDFRKSLIAEMTAEAGNDGTGRPNTTVRLPRNLNSARGNSRDLVDTSMFDDSQEGIFNSAFTPRSP